MSKFNKDKWLKNKEEQVNDLEKKINNLVKNFRENEEDIVEFIKFSSKFRIYSPRNTMLIYAQNKSSTFIASFKEISNMGYKIRKGEKAIKILAPTQKKYVNINGVYKTLSNLTPKEKEQIEKEDPNILTKTYFTPINVFDIRQSDIPKEDIPKFLGYNNLINIDVSDKLKVLENFLINDKDIPIKYINLPLNVKGLYDATNHNITINEKLDNLGKLSTLTHELGHALLHNLNSKYHELNSDMQEVQSDISTILFNEYFNIPEIDSRIRHLKFHISRIPEKEITNLILPTINAVNKVIVELEEKIPGKYKNISPEKKVDKIFNKEQSQEKETEKEKTVSTKETELER